MSDQSYAPESHYDRVTRAWTLLLGDQLHYGVFHSEAEDLSTATRELTRLMVMAARIEPGVEVLDVGSGTGAPACELAREHHARVTGITTSAVGIELARKRAVAERVEDVVSFERRDGMNNGLPDRSFDRVWVLESSHLMRRRDALLAECARVLRPGGWLALCDVMLRRPMPFLEVRRLREPLALLRAVFGDARMERLPQYAKLAGDCGLLVQEQRDLTAATRRTFSCWRENANRHRDELVASLGGAQWQRFVEACRILEAFWDDGTLGYGLLSARKP